jgi:hypothetical protein
MAEHCRLYLHGDDNSSRDGAFSLNQDAELTDIFGTCVEYVVPLAVLPNQTNLAIDRNAGMKSPIGPR